MTVSYIFLFSFNKLTKNSLRYYITYDEWEFNKEKKIIKEKHKYYQISYDDNMEIGFNDGIVSWALSHKYQRKRLSKKEFKKIINKFN